MPDSVPNEPLVRRRASLLPGPQNKNNNLGKVAPMPDASLLRAQAEAFFELARQLSSDPKAAQHALDRGKNLVHEAIAIEEGQSKSPPTQDCVVVDAVDL